MNCYFFGTFNPIHLGHIEIATQVRQKCNFDRVIFVPSYIPPHKTSGVVSYRDRLEMLKLAVGEDNVSDIELKLPVPSYSYRTVEKLCELDNVSRINFIVGYDQFFQLESWKEPEKIKNSIHFIVIPRRFQNGQTINDVAFNYFKNKGYSYDIIDIDFLDVSSNMVRKNIAQGISTIGLIKQEVREYIENNRLYKQLAKEKFVR